MRMLSVHFAYDGSAYHSKYRLEIPSRSIADPERVGARRIYAGFVQEVLPFFSGPKER